MRKRLLLSLGLLACLGAALTVAVWVRGKQKQLNREAFDKIEVGMTHEDAEAVLETSGFRLTAKKVVGEGYLKTFHHAGDGILVGFLVKPGTRDTLIVSGKGFLPSEEVFADKLRRWLGLPWW